MLFIAFDFREIQRWHQSHGLSTGLRCRTLRLLDIPRLAHFSEATYPRFAVINLVLILQLIELPLDLTHLPFLLLKQEFVLSYLLAQVLVLTRQLCLLLKLYFHVSKLAL